MKYENLINSIIPLPLQVTPEEYEPTLKEMIEHEKYYILDDQTENNYQETKVSFNNAKIYKS